MLVAAKRQHAGDEIIPAAIAPRAGDCGAVWRRRPKAFASEAGSTIVGNLDTNASAPCFRLKPSELSQDDLLAQTADPASDDLVPMGQIAGALGVVPGTATTMMKALAESGLVRYEPYMGVRLTPAGEKLAGLVLRRHRLIELFLVKVLNMSWAEVHDEAERLEHAVSESLIDRIDEMLGRPAVDPHGDPIPSAEGRVPRLDHVDLLSAPLNASMVVTASWTRIPSS
jgi:Mn-dependent DtxR family transcriptional regulator